MKTSELMLGDIITFRDSVETDKTPIPVKVIALGYQHNWNENEALVQIGDDETCDIVTIDDEFVGYPLTPEILEKNGFGYYSIGGAEQWLIKDDYYDIKVYKWSDSIWVARYESTEMYIPFEQATMSYVHELQHFLRTSGIEKEIEL